MHPRDLPASVLQRLPVRFSYDDNYFSDTFQGIPITGYTELVQNILSSNKIQLKLNTRYENRDTGKYRHVFYHEKTICTKEFSRACEINDIPFYPVLHAGGNDILDQYLAESKKETSTTFVGRLGTHQYLDMGAAVDRAILAADKFQETL